jgi:hypothetical protein
MQKTMTRQQLYQLAQEISSLKNESPALALLLDKQIKLFYAKAGMQLKIQEQRFRAIQEKYIQKDDKGNFIIQGEGETREWQYITSKIDLENARVLDVSMVKEAFNKECSTFFSQTISFDW